ncbi:unnamed protein product [Cyprideis torosa]|uniref:18 kDa Sin3-associated polypeptide n=1 Tax=Cyprideis torosa TaxID=163714 RepID=A0A7R8W9I6_9CRUS|nr:unnamed protein product [Cyprideis torosa]CAG0884340.1 unnamed protein product [Cyprideis torosa]
MSHALVSHVEGLPKLEDKPVDREKTCPLLLRVFYCFGRHHPVGEYRNGLVPANELQIYTWKDATLKELTALVKEVNEDARRRGTFFDFSLVVPDSRPGSRIGSYIMREIGSTCSGRKGSDDSKTLNSVRFTIGDYMDIAIHPPNQMRPGGREREMMMDRGGPIMRGGRDRDRMRPY